MSNGLLQIALILFLFIIPDLSLAQADEGVLTWSQNRKLKWEDFKGSINNDDTHVIINLQRKGETDAARSRIAISLGFWCEDGKADHLVTAEFEQKNSWSLAEFRNPDVLAHEQVHFDLAELYARKLRAELAKLPNACDRNVVGKLYYRIDAAFVEMTKQYDMETSHGTDKTKQAEWNRKVQALLQHR